MSTRSSIYYDGPIHIWYEHMDGRYYVSFDEDGTGNHYPVWRWLALAMARGLRMTNRVKRFEAECERARQEYIRTEPQRKAERERLLKILEGNK